MIALQKHIWYPWTCCRSIAGRGTQRAILPHEFSYQAPSSVAGESEPVNLSHSWIINSCEVWVIFYFGFNRKVIGVWNWTRPQKRNTGIPHRGTICRLDLPLFESQMHFSWYKVGIEQWVCIVNGDWCEHRFWRFSHMLYILEILKIWFSHNMSHMLIFWRDRNDNL